MPHQSDLAQAAGMKQSRISVMEMPGAVNFNLETLVRLASVLRVGLLVKFVSFSEMLNWENDFSQDDFAVTRLDDDADFLIPPVSTHALNQTGGRTIPNWEAFPLSKSPGALHKICIAVGTAQFIEVNVESCDPKLPQRTNDVHQRVELTGQIREDRQWKSNCLPQSLL